MDKAEKLEICVCRHTYDDHGGSDFATCSECDCSHYRMDPNYFLQIGWKE